MRAIGQTVVGCQATVCSIISQRIDSRGCTVARVLGIKGANGTGGHFFRPDKATQRTHRDAGCRVAVIDLVGGATTTDGQSFFVNHGAVRGIGQGVVSRQATIRAIDQGVDRSYSSGPSIFNIKGPDGAGRDAFRTNKTAQRANGDACVVVAVIGFVKGSRASDAERFGFNPADCVRCVRRQGVVAGIDTCQGQTTETHRIGCGDIFAIEFCSRVDLAHRDQITGVELAVRVGTRSDSHRGCQRGRALDGGCCRAIVNFVRAGQARDAEALRGDIARHTRRHDQVVVAR